jgi:hypothetical protein
MLAVMIRLAKLQLAGPLALFGAILAAEAAAWALAYTPASELLWYFNLKWFAAFQRSHGMISAYISVDYAQLLAVALPLLIMALFGYASGRQLPLAVASNLSFVYASFLAYAWCDLANAPETAAITSIDLPTGPDRYLFMVLIGASLVSFVISHLLYLRSVRTRA